VFNEVKFCSSFLNATNFNISQPLSSNSCNFNFYHSNSVRARPLLYQWYSYISCQLHSFILRIIFNKRDSTKHEAVCCITFSVWLLYSYCVSAIRTLAIYINITVSWNAMLCNSLNINITKELVSSILWPCVWVLDRVRFSAFSSSLNMSSPPEQRPTADVLFLVF
jgi:hypothetical protein